MAVNIDFPDGASRQFEAPPTGEAIAQGVSPSLARNAVAIRVDGELRDLTRPIEHDASVEIITRDSDDGLEILRHDAAHVMAEAVKELFPDTQVTIGPAIENGFYYDFARDEPFSSEHLEQIEERMRQIVDRDEAVVRELWDRDEAIRYFSTLR